MKRWIIIKETSDCCKTLQICHNLIGSVQVMAGLRLLKLGNVKNIFWVLKLEIINMLLTTTTLNLAHNSIFHVAKLATLVWQVKIMFSFFLDLYLTVL